MLSVSVLIALTMCSAASLIPDPSNDAPNTAWLHFLTDPSHVSIMVVEVSASQCGVLFTIQDPALAHSSASDFPNDVLPLDPYQATHHLCPDLSALPAADPSRCSPGIIQFGPPPDELAKISCHCGQDWSSRDESIYYVPTAGSMFAHLLELKTDVSKVAESKIFRDTRTARAEAAVKAERGRLQRLADGVCTFMHRTARPQWIQTLHDPIERALSPARQRLIAEEARTTSIGPQVDRGLVGPADATISVYSNYLVVQNGMCALVFPSLIGGSHRTRDDVVRHRACLGVSGASVDPFAGLVGLGPRIEPLGADETNYPDGTSLAWQKVTDIVKRTDYAGSDGFIYLTCAAAEARTGDGKRYAILGTYGFDPNGPGNPFVGIPAAPKLGEELTAADQQDHPEWVDIAKSLCGSIVALRNELTQ